MLHAGIVHWLRSDNEDQVGIAAYILAHEAAHVHELDRCDRAVPGMFLPQLPGDEEQSYLLQTAEACWDEYAACRYSASIYPKQGTHLETTFCDRLTSARPRADAAIRAYRIHDDHARVFGEVYPEYANLLKYASYLLGHLHGTDATLAAGAPRAHELLGRMQYFTAVFDELNTCLHNLWTTRDQWQGMNAYEPLKRIARETLRNGGMELSTVPEGLYIRVRWQPT